MAIAPFVARPLDIGVDTDINANVDGKVWVQMEKAVQHASNSG